MKIVLIGYGKMGKAIETAAKEENMEVVGRFDVVEEKGVNQSFCKEIIDQADVCIEFTHPKAVMDNVKKLIGYKKPIVIGTTGWYEQREYLEKLFQEEGVGGIWAENYSLGMQGFIKIIKEAAKIFDPLTDYDVCGYEMHHRQKADSPSGTAEIIVENLLEQMSRKNGFEYERYKEKPDPKKIHFSSIRCGSIPGTHTVLFDSSFDSISLTHQARNREGLAKGVLCAAKWVQNKKGLFHIQDMLGG